MRVVAYNVSHPVSHLKCFKLMFSELPKGQLSAVSGRWTKKLFD